MISSSLKVRSGAPESARWRVELAGEVLELAPQLFVLEDLLEGRGFELLDRLERGRAVAHQVAQFEARFDFLNRKSRFLRDY